jgi:hypothetical protein
LEFVICIESFSLFWVLGDLRENWASRIAQTYVLLIQSIYLLHFIHSIYIIHPFSIPFLYSILWETRKHVTFALLIIESRNMVFQVENLSPMNTDPWYSAFFCSHPPLVERLAALDEPDKKEDWVGNLCIRTKVLLHAWIPSVLRTCTSGPRCFESEVSPVALRYVNDFRNT